MLVTPLENVDTARGASTLAVVALYISPFEFEPQQYTPASLMTHAFWLFTETAVIPELKKLAVSGTSVGTDTLVVLPSPNCPLVFLPQQ
jgi:hypothetical protein